MNWKDCGTVYTISISIQPRKKVRTCQQPAAAGMDSVPKAKHAFYRYFTMGGIEIAFKVFIRMDWLKKLNLGGA